MLSTTSPPGRIMNRRWYVSITAGSKQTGGDGALAMMYSVVVIPLVQESVHNRKFYPWPENWFRSRKIFLTWDPCSKLLSRGRKTDFVTWTRVPDRKSMTGSSDQQDTMNCDRKRRAVTRNFVVTGNTWCFPLVTGKCRGNWKKRHICSQNRIESQ